jgi:hypothetical protein
MNFYGTTVGPQHTLFGRVPPVMEAMHLAVLRASEQPTPPAQLANAAPPWVHNVANELTCTVFKGIVNMAPVGNKYQARKAGQITGLLIRAAIFWCKEAAVIWEREGLTKLTPERERKLEKFTGWEVGCAQASKLAGRPITTKAQAMKFLKDRITRFALRTGKLGLNLTWFAVRQPVSEVAEFIAGLYDGFKCFLNDDGDFAKTGKRTEIFIVLVMYWPEIEEMRQAKPPVTRKFLLDWLEKQEGKQLAESDKIFSALCDDISLDMAPPGHPFNPPQL